MAMDSHLFLVNEFSYGPFATIIDRLDRLPRSLTRARPFYLTTVRFSILDSCNNVLCDTYTLYSASPSWLRVSTTER